MTCPPPSRAVLAALLLGLAAPALGQTTATPPAKAAPSRLGHSEPGKPTPVVQAPHPARIAKSGPAKPAAHAAPPPAAAPATEAPAPAVAAPEKPAEPTVGTNTHLPLPRWAALRADEVNFRSGPGTRYPIDWQYHRRDLPVQIEREFEVWRLVEDSDGIKGWVHQATITGRRSFVVTGAERTLRSAAAEDAAAVARLKPGVVGRLRSCEAQASWCEVQVGEYRGWLKRSDFYGTYPGEAVNG